MKIKLYNQNIWGNMSPRDVVGNRNGLIKNLICNFDADVCCFQECNPNTSRFGDNDISKVLAPTYIEAATPVGNDNFTPVYYKKDRFEAVDILWDKYSGFNDKNSKSFTRCVLREKSSGEKFCIISTHFWYMVKTEEDFAQRIQNVIEVCAAAREAYEKFDCPVIICGDLNCGKNYESGTAPLEKFAELDFDNLRNTAERIVGDFTWHDYPTRGENDIYHCEATPIYTLDHAFMYPKRSIRVTDFVINVSPEALASADHCPMQITFEV